MKIDTTKFIASLIVSFFVALIMTNFFIQGDGLFAWLYRIISFVVIFSGALYYQLKT
jgi:multisubunit Na+/H+ antiporter MnhE subunit